MTIANTNNISKSECASTLQSLTKKQRSAMKTLEKGEYALEIETEPSTIFAIERSIQTANAELDALDSAFEALEDAKCKI